MNASRRRAPDEQQVRAMFDGLVERYDVLNDILSLGLDRWWRRVVAGSVRVRSGERVLDLGCGTGRLGGRLSDRCRVTGLDVSLEMLRAARGVPGVTLVQGSAFRLPFADASFAAAVSGFVLRNLDDLDGAFAELARVVVPGATIALVDITEPPSPLMRRFFDVYFSVAAPALGALTGNRDAYRYLVHSLGQLAPVREICSMLERAGFVSARARPLTGGMVTLFTAERKR